MNEQDELRFAVKLLKAKGIIKSYKVIAEMMEIVSVKSFYSWLNGDYTFGYTKKNKLKNIVKALSE